MVEAIFAILITFAPWHGDTETSAARAARFMTIAQGSYSAAIEATCTEDWRNSDWCKVVWGGSVVELVALHAVIGRAESNFAEHVGAGRCRPWECDHNLARHYWQVQRGPQVSQELWAELRGIEYIPTAQAAYAASRVLGQGLTRCKSIEGAISFYARSHCRWAGAKPRFQMYERVLRRLQSETLVAINP